MRVRRLRKAIYRVQARDDRLGRLALSAALLSYRLCDSVFLKRASRPDFHSEKILLPESRMLFVAVPKVATRSLIAALRSTAKRQEELKILEYDLPTLLHRYPDVGSFFKFTFVRNPWSRVTSCYLEKIQQVNPVKHARHLHGRYGLRPGMTFREFAEWLNSSEGADEVADRHWMSQHRILGKGEDGLIEYDFVGRFERLEQDYEMLGKLTGVSLPKLPHILRTQKKASYKTLYCDYTKELIRRRYARDIEVFGYAFDS